jgi:hypothetical protein
MPILVPIYTCLYTPNNSNLISLTERFTYFFTYKYNMLKSTSPESAKVATNTKVLVTTSVPEVGRRGEEMKATEKS